MQVLSINELTVYLNAVLDADPLLSDVWVQGEVSNCKRHSSGHWYLTLKEGDVRIDAVCWRSTAARLTTIPRDGMAVLVHGKISVYNSRVQVYIDYLRPAGEGILQAQLERLKAKLQAEGLFERKRELPLHPRRIGIVTSPTGAALRDMYNVLSRRYPLAEVVLAPAQVQGDGAADTIVEALYDLYDLSLDVIIVARGGGSIEDLWCFNEEIVARAIFAAPVPVVTGVGHETDTTLVDYVSDLRAPTPSAAAELITPDCEGLRCDVADRLTELQALIHDRLFVARADVEQVQGRLERAAPITRLHADRQRLDALLDRARRSIEQRTHIDHLHVKALKQSLRALNPEATLGRGYAIVTHADGRVVSTPDQVRTSEPLQIRVRGGTFDATVT